MIRIRRLVEIRQVAAHTGIGRIVVISIMTSRTIIRNSRMRPVERIIIIVHAKTSRRPARRRCMAARTVRIKPQRYMVGISRLIEIRRVTGRTGRRSTFKTRTVAVQTVDTHMRSREREGGGVVVKNQIGITGRMAGQTGIVLVYIAAHIFMRFIRFRIGMAAHTSKFCVVGRVGVAVRTLTPLALMRTTVDRKILRIVVKSGGHPGRFAVTARTVGRKLGRHVVGITGPVVVGQVATHTSIGRIVVITVVTGRAIIGNGRVRAIERIVIIVVGKSRRRPAGLGGMATRTVIAEA